MHPSTADTALWITGIVGESLLFLILLLRRSYRTFPVFFAWIAFLLLLEPTFYWLSHQLSLKAYLRAFFALSLPQYMLEAGVLIEIAGNVIRPVRKAISTKLMIALTVIMVLIAVAGLLAAASMSDASLADPKLYFVVTTTMAILRLGTFLLIAGTSQLLGLTWKNHVLQLTSGLAFYAVVTLIVEVAHSHLSAGPDYARQFYAWEHLRIGGYLCTLYFWCYAFVKKEAPRKEFSPQMTKILVSLSGGAKRQSAVLARTRDQ